MIEAPSALTIVEVSPRDGLQNEAVHVSTRAKIELITQLVRSGAKRIEAVSFAHPRHVPAMADAEQVMAGVPRPEGVSYAGLVLNSRGLDRALAVGVDEVNAVVCVSETFSQRNQRMSADGAMAQAVSVVERARARNLYTCITLATAFGCPFEGEVDLRRVTSFVSRALASGVDELCLADTIGVGVPTQVTRFAESVWELDDDVALRFHFHNTRNTGFANAVAAYAAGSRVLDASAAGIGGCPFAPNATGNVATEDMIYLFERMGVPTGFDLESLMPTSGYLAGVLGHDVPALLPRAGVFPASHPRGPTQIQSRTPACDTPTTLL